MKILGPNDYEYGLMIEYDSGFISPEHKENKKILGEAKDFDPSQDLILYAILQKYNTPNRNGRIYPKHILQREAERYKTLIEKGAAISELNHPDSSLIDLDRVSHSILEVWWDEHRLMGKIRILTSPGWKKSGIISCKGDQAANLLLNGVTLGISSRGVGSLKREGSENVVQDDFELICFDLVSSPSTPGAYLMLDPKDREKYDEELERDQPSAEASGEVNRSKSLMKKLDNFLGK